MVGPTPEVSGAALGDVEVGIDGVDGDVRVGSDEDAEDNEWL